MSRDRSTPKHWWTPSILKALGVFLAGFGAYWFAYDNLQPAVCPANYFGWEKVQKLVSEIPKCDGQWERYNTDQATDLMIKYLGSAGGSNPDQSRGYFLTSVRDTISDDEIEQQWGGVLWAGAIDNAQPLDGKFDRFYLRFRTFSGDGTTDDHDFSDGFITDWKIQFRMEQDPDDDNDPKIAKILDLRETHVERNQHYPRIRATTDTEAYTLPTKESDPTGAIDWRTDMPAPDLCYTAVPLGSENYWFRTRLGWVDGSDFKIEEEQGLTRECPRVASRRAKAMNASATGTQRSTGARPDGSAYILARGDRLPT